MVAERVPKPLINWTSFNSHNFSTVDPMLKILGFSESLERDLSNGIIKFHIWEIKVFTNLAVPWIIAHGLRPKINKLEPQWILDWNTLFERSLSRLSENQKSFDIGLTIPKLWLLKLFKYLPPPVSMVWRLFQLEFYGFNFKNMIVSFLHLLVFKYSNV